MSLVAWFRMKLPLIHILDRVTSGRWVDAITYIDWTLRSRKVQIAERCLKFHLFG